MYGNNFELGKLEEYVMWDNLSETEKFEYKKMILAFASLSEMFAQKAEPKDGKEVIIKPIINSKYQETVFQRVFNATVEDIKNTSYDVSLKRRAGDGHVVKYLVGIKTFGKNSGAQKIAQFKGNIIDLIDIMNEISSNSKGHTDKREIDIINEELYKKLAIKVSKLRNLRIDSSISQVQGFSVSDENDDVQAVYHVLMPATNGGNPCIFVGETSYDKIDVDNIKVIGCTS